MVTGSIADYSVLSTQDAVNVGIDMGNRRWEMVVVYYRTGAKRHFSFQGGDAEGRAIAKVKELVEAGHLVHVVYEIGRNGFEPARRLRQECGVTVSILPVNRLEVVCSGKRVKTDRIDAAFLAGLDPRLMARLPQVWTPPIDAECRRRALTEKRRLTTSIQRVNNQIISILKRWPVPSVDTHRSAEKWSALFEQWKAAGDDAGLPRLERLIIVNMIAELETFEANLARWEAVLAEEEDRHRHQAREAGGHTTAEILRQYRGVGIEISRYFDWYLGDLHRFKRAGSLARYLGLTPTPFSSGNTNREQGISKEGNKELRRLMIQLAWLWRQYQPDSALARKWAPQLARPGRQRKTAIVALARQLAVAFYRLIIHGEPIEGAEINTPLPAL